MARKKRAEKGRRKRAARCRVQKQPNQQGNTSARNKRINKNGAADPSRAYSWPQAIGWRQRGREDRVTNRQCETGTKKSNIVSSCQLE